MNMMSMLLFGCFGMNRARASLPLHGPSGLTQVWPIPSSAVCDSGSTRLSSKFKIQIASSSSSPRLLSAVQRYTALIPLTPAPNGMQTLVLHVATPDDGNVPSIHSDYSYNLSTTSKTNVVATATSVFGAMYAMETFSHLVNSTGYFGCSSLQLYDTPAYVRK